MGDMLSVKVLGESYLLPTDILEYVKILHQFDKRKAELVSILTPHIKNGSYCYDEDIKRGFRKTACAVIKDLSDHNIYDISETDLVDDNLGYKRFIESTKNCVRALSQIALEEMQSLQEGMYNAQSDAYSSVTGSGIGILTNSFIYGLTYIAFENNVINDQIAKAERQYSTAINELCKRNEDSMTRKYNHRLTSVDYPEALMCIDEFIINLQDKYLLRLEAAAILDYKLLKKYNLKHSSDILKNISQVASKEKVIAQAFSECPYNVAIFYEIIKYDTFDYDTYKTAQLFFDKRELLGLLKNMCNGNRELVISNPKLLDIISAEEGITVSKAFETLFKSDINSIYGRLDSYLNMLSSNTALCQWIKKTLSNSTDMVIDNGIALLEKECSATKSTELLNTIEKFCTIPEKYKSYNNCMCTASEFYKNIVADLKAKLQAYIDDAKIRKDEFLRALEVYKDELKPYEEKISALQNEKESLGFLSFRKKKAIEEAINEAQAILFQKKNSTYPKKLEQRYKDMTDY